MTNKEKLNNRLKQHLRVMLGQALKFYEYDIDALLAMDDAELERTLLDYLARYARDRIFYEDKKT